MCKVTPERLRIFWYCSAVRWKLLPAGPLLRYSELGAAESKKPSANSTATTATKASQPKARIRPRPKVASSRTSRR